MNVDVYLLDWNKRRPWVKEAEDLDEVRQRFNGGDYEYSFTVTGLSYSETDDVWGCEAVYRAQGNNPEGHKVRADRQSMAEGDLAVVDGRVYVCAGFGFLRYAVLDGKVQVRVQQSWERWTADADDEEEARTADVHDLQDMLAVQRQQTETPR